jgi:malonate-semialdehyde dehydrogenase (acetylating)/methylmalonate-semialdehyde dehydrogenase
VPLVINGKFVESKTDQWINNYNPATNELISRVPCATQDEMDAAIQSAQDAFPAWKEKSILARQQVMFQFRNLIKKHWVSLLEGSDCSSLLGLE